MNKILITLVLYKTKLEESISFKTFNANKNALHIDFELLIFNNSKEITIEENPSEYIIINSTENKQLSGAYNFAYKTAIEKNINWILLLDQDTELTSVFFEEINHFFIQKQKDYTAAVPMLEEKQKQLSPMKYHPVLGAFAFLKPISTTKEKANCLVAFNSGTLIKVDFLKKSNGFSKKYPLDYLDYWLFYHIYKNNEKVYILNAKLQQNLSVLDYKNRMNENRYNKILEAENTFAKEIGIVSLVIYKCRIVSRFFIQLFNNEKKKYVKHTFLSLFNIKK